MIKLGNIRHAGVNAVAQRAYRSLRDHGKVALYVGANSEAAAIPYYHPDYDYWLARHGKHLVGIYLYEEAPDYANPPRPRLAADITKAHQEHAPGAAAHG